MCDTRKQRYSRKYDMDFGLFKRIADKLFLHAQQVDLRGFGESTIHPRFEEFVDYALKYDCDFGLVTNLALKKDSLWRKLVEKNFWLGISIDGATKEIFEKIRKGSKFETIIHNLELIQKIRDKNNINPWMIYFLVTLQKKNIDELENIIKFAHKFGINRIELSPVQLPFFNYNKLEFHKERTEKNLKKAIAYAKKNNIRILFHGDLTTGEIEQKNSQVTKIKRCKHPWTHLYIAYDGRIGPCNMMPLVLGDLKKENFREEWNNKAFQRFRKYNDTKFRYRVCNWCYKNRYDHF
ncbi:MAG: SPASM domain-containing protein [Candidatus Cloacimonetes bacterium]|nr:SPASM domain-containing protein [Candidatus Cloacimonadota bacterium]